MPTSDEVNAADTAGADSKRSRLRRRGEKAAGPAWLYKSPKPRSQISIAMLPKVPKVRVSKCDTEDGDADEVW